MIRSQLNHYVVFLSPAGTTRTVAEAIAGRLQCQGIEPQVVDLSAGAMPSLAFPCCLWLGSPVYVDHAVPQVSALIRQLPSREHGYAVPFVTWGAVCSGVALPEMAQQLAQRGWHTVGAAKVLAVHSSLWQSDRPLGGGRPDASDLAVVTSLVDQVVEKLRSDSPAQVENATLRYLPPAQEQQSWQKSLEKAKAMLGDHQPDSGKCRGCGRCVDHCPVGAIAWRGERLQVTQSCIRCHQCTRHCPHQAFAWNGPAMEQRLQEMAAASEEVAETEIFV